MPAYNENRKIERAARAALAGLSEIASTYEVIIAEDGSSDGTYETAVRLAESDHHIRLLHSGDRQGRGQALNAAIKAARGRVVCYIDADLATDMSHLGDLVDAIRCEGYDIATGSRLMPESDTGRSIIRSAASISYNALVRLMLRSRLYDHQCGFKALKRETTAAVLDEIRDNHWFWDTELLVRGQRAGLRAKEIPVIWRAADSTKVNVLKDSYSMGSKTFKLWWDLLRDHK
ncbi:MAG TPA: glycosyltransferase [Methanotrichaceae archaeon]|nr:glycosyltransferase [Methanotrichaceae archaeon]